MKNKELILMRLNKEPLAQIENIRNLSITKSISGVNELSFTIDKFYQTKEGKKINPVYEMITSETLIELDGEEIYMVIDPLEVATEEGALVKEVTAFSKEYELRDKLIFKFEGENRVIYDPSNQKDKNGVYYGLLNYLEEKTGWRVSYYNTDVLKRYKTLSLDKVNLLQAVLESQQDFECILNFNTQNETIDILDVSQIGSDRGLYLSDENFIQELKKDFNKENIITRLYCFGNDDLDISRVNITGEPYIEDYSYFMNEEFMSKELINALKKNQEQIEKESAEWDKTFSKLLEQEREFSNQSNGIRLQEGQLENLQQDFDNNIEDEKEREKIRKKIEDKEITIHKMKLKLEEIENKIKTTNKELNKISDRVSFDNNLSPELLKELNYFVKEEVYNTDYGKYDLDILYAQGKKLLNRISKPYIEFELSLDDFTRMTETQDIKHLLRLGDIVNIEHKKLNEYYQVRIIGYTQTEDGIDITFSSKESIWNQEMMIEDILAEADNTSKTVDFSKFHWDKAQVVDNEFRKYIQSELNLANQGVVKAEGQRPVLDDRGLWLYKEGKDGVPLPEQIRAVNNIIAITKDNWNTVDVAITPKGVMANQLIGDIILGTDLKIMSDSGVVEIVENLLTVRDKNGIPRVQLGQYDTNKYGLKLTDESGRNTILDEGGMLQMWQEGRADNVDGSNGLKIHLYIPDNTRKIYKAQLRYSLEKFRSYSNTTDIEEQTTETTSWDGGTYTSTGWDGGTYTSTGGGGAILTTTGDGGGVSATTFGGKTYDIDWIETWLAPDRDAPRGGHWFRMVTGHDHEIVTEDHTHDIEVEEHQHSISIGGHDHSVSIDGHDHTVKIPEHSHEILPIIKVHDETPGYCRIFINGSNRTFALTGSSTVRGDQDDLDITRYLNKGKWNTIEIKSNSLGRIDATVFVQALINFNYD